MNNTQKFSGKADAYASARPSYPNALYVYLKNEYDLGMDTVIADIASGTGKFTQPLLQAGCTVYAVEPNDDMRRQAEKLLGKYDHFISVNGSAENTGLTDHSVDFVSAAQAFHWFDAQLFKAECKRILKSNCKVFILYNSHDAEAPVTVRLAEVCRALCPDFKGFSGGMKSKNVESFFGGKFDFLTFKNDLNYTRKTFVERMLSSSYAPREEEENYPAFVSELGAVFDAFSKDGILHMPNNTELYAGTP